MYFPTSEQTSMQPEWQISLPSEPGHESTSASLIRVFYFFFHLPFFPSSLPSPRFFPKSATAFRFREVTLASFLLSFLLINLSRVDARSPLDTLAIVPFRLLSAFDGTREHVDWRIPATPSPSLPSNRERRNKFGTKRVADCPGRNLFRVAALLVSRDWVRVLVYCKSKLFPGVRDIAQDRL